MSRFIYSLSWPILITVSALGLLLVSGTTSPLRVTLTFWFLFLCPGMAFIRLFRFESRITELTLAIALSLALNTLISETMILARIWSAWVCLLIVMSITMIGVLIQTVQVFKTPHSQQL